MKIPGLSVGQGESDLPWKPTQTRGVHWLPLHLEPNPADSHAPATKQRAAASVLIRMAPGVGYGAHRHLGAEDVLVLRGGYRDELGRYECGEHAHYPAGSVHTPVALGDSAQPEGADNPACILFAVASGGIELLG